MWHHSSEFKFQSYNYVHEAKKKFFFSKAHELVWCQSMARVHYPSSTIAAGHTLDELLDSRLMEPRSCPWSGDILLRGPWECSAVIGWASHLLPWCALTLIQSGCLIPNGTCTPNLFLCVALCSATGELSWCLLICRPTQQGWYVRCRSLDATSKHPPTLLPASLEPLRSPENLHRPYVQFLSFCAPITMSWIISLHRVHSLRHHALEESIPSLILPALRDRTCSPLKYPVSHAEPATYQKVPDKPSTQIEYCLPCDDAGHIGNYASSTPLQFATFLHDCQS